MAPLRNTKGNWLRHGYLNPNSRNTTLAPGETGLLNHDTAWRSLIPGCKGTQWQDPCLPPLDKEPYAGETLTPLDVAHDRGWQVCYCTYWHGQWTLHPEPDCSECHGHGVVVQPQAWLHVPPFGWLPDSQYHDCLRCDGGPDAQQCAQCLGTGLNFVPSPGAPSAPLRYGEYEPFELGVNQALALAYPEPQPESWLWDLEVLTLESKERRPCGTCVDGVETANGTQQECRSCKGKGSLPLFTGKWLCNVNQETGEHFPRFLPTEHTTDWRGSTVLRPKRPLTRSWRTTDGKDKNRPYSVFRTETSNSASSSGAREG